MQVFQTGKEVINVRISCSCFSMSQNPSLESKRLCTACLQNLRSKKHFTETRQFSLSSDCWASKFVTPMDRIHPRRTDSSKARQLSSISHNVKTLTLKSSFYRSHKMIIWVSAYLCVGKETKTSTNPNLRCGDWTIHTIFDGFIRILCHVPFSLSCHQENDSILKLFLQTDFFCSCDSGKISCTSEMFPVILKFDLPALLESAQRSQSSWTLWSYSCHTLCRNDRLSMSSFKCTQVEQTSSKYRSNVHFWNCRIYLDSEKTTKGSTAKWDDYWP